MKIDEKETGAVSVSDAGLAILAFAETNREIWDTPKEDEAWQWLQEK